jgi:uncharacterized protein YkwD
MLIKNYLLNLVFLCFFLSACGGGDSNDTSKLNEPKNDGDMPPPVQIVRPSGEPAPPASAPAPPASTPAPPSNYESRPEPVNSAELNNAVSGAKAVFELLNAERTRCGFSALKRHATLDSAARNHARWILLNWTSSHTESPNTPGFTGLDFGDRVDQVGGYYWGSLAEILNTNFNSFVSLDWKEFGKTGMRSLMSAPFHMAGAFAPNHDVGISIALSADDPTADVRQTRKGYALVLEFADVPKFVGTQNQQFLTYPCDGTTGTVTRLSNETPNPVPGRNLSTNPVGQPIMIVAGKKEKLTVTTATMTDAKNNNIVTLPLLTHANDANKMVAEDTAFLIPDKPLSSNASYTVTLRGTSGQTPFDRTFTFSTGN